MYWIVFFLDRVILRIKLFREFAPVVTGWKTHLNRGGVFLFVIHALTIRVDDILRAQILKSEDALHMTHFAGKCEDSLWRKRCRE